MKLWKYNPRFCGIYLQLILSWYYFIPITESLMSDECETIGKDAIPALLRYCLFIFMEVQEKTMINLSKDSL